jgi:VWFA-related protein
MGTPGPRLVELWMSLLLAVCWQTAGPVPFLMAQQETPNPVLKERPPAKAAASAGAIARRGGIQLDVMVRDGAGSAVSGLQPWDFAVTDNGEARKVLTFRAFDGIAAKPQPPVEVILMLDMVNLPFQQVAFVREQVEQFLKENDGHLREPVALMVLTSAGLRVQQRPSLDGNALVGIVRGIKGGVSSINPAMGGPGLVERFQLSVKQLEAIAENGAKAPGRKLLIWIGPGWPMLDVPDEGYSRKDQLRYFDAIVELSTKLREAQMALYSVSPQDATPDSGLRSQMYRAFLKGVKAAEQADSGNLALKVLVTQSGGLILGPDNDLAGQVDRCVGEANAFYRISFNPPPAAHRDEYHELKIAVDKPGLTVRTTSAYYNQPLSEER